MTLPRSATDLVAVLDDLAGPAQAAELWDVLTGAGRIPFIDGNQVVFLYHGDAGTVEWQGDFTGWEWGTPLAGSRLSGTDVWYLTVTLPPDARVLYELLVNGEPILDPSNEATQLSPDLKSVLVMPEFMVSDETSHRAGVAPGTLSDGVIIESGAMGYPISYQVYLPSGYDSLTNLPVLYVTDGSDFSHPDMGGMPAVLDNLIGVGRIPPALAVFVDAWSPGRVENRRETEFLERPADYARFLATELVPQIDATYRTDPSLDARTLVGVSYGGLGAVAIAVLQPDVFGTLALFSPTLYVLDDPRLLGDPTRVASYEAVAALADEATACGPDTGQDCPPLRLFMTSGLPEWDVPALAEIAASFEKAGLDHRFIQVNEGHGWAHWSGLTDEMLEFVLTG